MSASAFALLFIIRLISVYNILIFARVIASWIIQDHEHPIFRFLYGITEPLLGPLRQIIPAMGIDLSPIIAYFLLRILAQILTSLL